MTPERWRQIEDLCSQALDRDPRERIGFLRKACGVDEELLREVESLLSGEKTATFLGEPAVAHSAQELGDRERRLAIGAQLGPYRIEEVVGQGGMGAVYLARDTRLDRAVALKTLQANLASNQDLMQRFLREAKAASAFNHPNVAAIYDVGETDGTRFIAMEYVKGQTLAAKLADGPLDRREIVEIGIQVADALHEAHTKGITHRDIKPANLMLTARGQVKVLDFGVAKISAPDQHVNAEARLTETGSLIGTVQYMSPEQVLGHDVDHRTDIFSLGVVLYEMATGRLPFAGTTRGETMDRILHTEPEAVPPLDRGELSRIVRRCLEKDRNRRYASANDLWIDLKNLQRQAGEAPVAAPHARHSRLRRNWALAGLLVLIGAALWYRLSRNQAERDVGFPTNARFTQLTSQRGPEWFPSLSPDGQFVAYAGGQKGNLDIYMLRVGGQNPIDLTADTSEDDSEPAISPDGKYIAFRSERSSGGIWVIETTGESPRRLTDFGFNPAWSPDSKRLVIATEDILNTPTLRYGTSELWVISIASGEQRLLYKGDAVQPQWSPNGLRIVYWAQNNGQRDIWTIRADGSDPVPLTMDPALDWNPVWSPDGSFVYFSSDRGGNMNLWRVRVDEKEGKPRGQPDPVTTGVSAAAEHLSFSRDGRRMVYASDATSSNIMKVGFDPLKKVVEGQATAITEGSISRFSPELSPDGQWLVFEQQTATQRDIVISRPDGASQRNLTNDRFNDRVPRWSPDGKWIAFHSNRTGDYRIWLIHPDGSGARQITTSESFTPTWSPDGTRLAYNSLFTGEVFILELTAPVNTPPARLPPFRDRGESFRVWSWSPDGKRLAGGLVDKQGLTNTGLTLYSLESKQFETIGVPGWNPIWLADNRTLLFVGLGSPVRLYAVDRMTKQVREVLNAIPDSIGGWPSLSRDNRALYYEIVRNESDIWLISLP
jgi:Tol biopolymer transport system component/predicted Ser/Thr protein kinase